MLPDRVSNGAFGKNANPKIRGSGGRADKAKSTKKTKKLLITGVVSISNLFY